MRISDWSSDVCSSDLIGKNTIFGAIINAVKSDTTSNLLATPHIVTLDNQPAKFLVGQEVPITTGEALSDNFDEAFPTVQREEVGIQLDVTPQVNEIGRAACRERVCQYVEISVVSVSLKKHTNINDSKQK